MASWVLDSVAAWAAPAARLLREVELIGQRPGESVPYIPGRADGLLVPTIPWECGWKPKRGWCWDGISLAVVEVKVTMADWRRGLESGQYARYAEVAGALYLAVTEDMARLVKRDLPAGYGLLVHNPRGPALCARQAKPTGVEANQRMLWKVMHMLDAESRKREAAALAQGFRAREACGRAASRAIAAALKTLDPAEAS